VILMLSPCLTVIETLANSLSAMACATLTLSLHPLVVGVIDL
jgi:hypothetical protein